MPQFGQHKTSGSEGPRTDTRRLRRLRFGQEVGAPAPQTPKLLGGRGRRFGAGGNGKDAPSYGRGVRRREAISKELQLGSTFEERAFEWNRLFASGDNKPRQQKELLFHFTSSAPTVPSSLHSRVPVLDGPWLRTSCWWMGDLGYSR